MFRFMSGACLQLSSEGENKEFLPLLGFEWYGMINGLPMYRIFVHDEMHRFPIILLCKRDLPSAYDFADLGDSQVIVYIISEAPLTAPVNTTYIRKSYRINIRSCLNGLFSAPL